MECMCERKCGWVVVWVGGRGGRRGRWSERGLCDSEPERDTE